MVARVESDAEFAARIEAEEEDARRVKCPLDTCGAEPGRACMTEAGELRIRHSRRLMVARKLAGPMAVLNLRNVPEDLVRDLKKAAVDAGQPLHAFCLTVMRNGLQTLCLPYGPPPQAWDPGPVALRQAHDEAVGTTANRHAAVKVEIT